MATLALLGANTRYFGRVGDDHFGRFILSGLSDVGVNTSLVQVEPHKLSPVIDRRGRRVHPQAAAAVHPRQHHPARAAATCPRGC